MNAILFKIFMTVLGGASPSIVDEVRQMVRDLEAKASQTPNKFDDILVDLLKAITGA